ncbi:MAG: hypothetical protein ABI239_12955 [Aquihabitans sp.]
MPDLLYLVVTVAFFAVVAGFVTLCDRIIGPDSDHGNPQGAGETEPVDASRGAVMTTAAAEAVR